jgi:hypothetical protein
VCIEGVRQLDAEAVCDVKVAFDVPKGIDNQTDPMIRVREDKAGVA